MWRGRPRPRDVSIFTRAGIENVFSCGISELGNSTSKAAGEGARATLVTPHFRSFLDNAVKGYRCDNDVYVASHFPKVG